MGEKCSDKFRLEFDFHVILEIFYVPQICDMGPTASSSSIVSNFALCGMPILAQFYSRDFNLEMFSMRYVNTFSFFFSSLVSTTNYHAR